MCHVLPNQGLKYDNWCSLYHYQEITIGGVMFSVLASSAEDPGLEPRSGQTKDYNIGMCCSSAKHAALRRKGKD